MITITYECNLCHEELAPEHTVGLYYDGFWSIDAPENCTEHICRDCLNQMSDLEARLKTLEKERDNGQP